ncbi:hypothetical protein POX_f08124 [Penicillium oxalicum]|uniref:Thioesterase poxG n=1 Tax=Penicillium oxalicum (strain 114-2 / CGMCC 5302) TaxID=933388 RepID=POXG_PENO1|nr:hypothetical protein POX_f08124 [Penicillium oxalicum]S7ZEI0.1 RecName: Full=Thioesterase poxG; AltName: Full=Oxaleimides biosynthesis cluster protein G [Penicillium oxalicum 114-2]EPS29070.1 hypothetical protein PDE_04019 [Penicillium oxalicum 114-2]KAI2787747.1 hypothetical protein POX_f08124 [Penicillium oxalicum]
MVSLSCLISYGECLLETVQTHPWSTIGVVVFLSSVKNAPLMWHARLIIAVFYHSVTRKNDVVTIERYGRQGLFGYIVTSSRSPLYECDINGHKSDSTYFSDLDINRIHLITRLFKGAGDLSLRPDRPNVAPEDRPKKMRVLLGGTCCSFRREIKPYAAYEIHSRVLAWDEKWLYVVSYFVKPGSARKMASLQTEVGDKCEMTDLARSMVFTSAITKFVFKDGRKTVRPADALEEMGLLSASEEVVETSEAGEDLWTRSRVEERRKTGIKIAQHFIALDELHDQFEHVSEHPFLGKFGVLGTMF